MLSGVNMHMNLSGDRVPRGRREAAPLPLAVPAQWELPTRQELWRRRLLGSHQPHLQPRPGSRRRDRAVQKQRKLRIPAPDPAPAVRRIRHLRLCVRGRPGDLALSWRKRPERPGSWRYLLFQKPADPRTPQNPGGDNAGAAHRRPLRMAPAERNPRLARLGRHWPDRRGCHLGHPGKV